MNKLFDSVYPSCYYWVYSKGEIDMAKTKRLNIRVRPTVKKMIKQKCRRDGFENVTEWVTWILKKA